VNTPQSPDPSLWVFEQNRENNWITRISPEVTPHTIVATPRQEKSSSCKSAQISIRGCFQQLVIMISLQKGKAELSIPARYRMVMCLGKTGACSAEEKVSREQTSSVTRMDQQRQRFIGKTEEAIGAIPIASSMLVFMGFRQPVSLFQSYFGQQ
jgi:hypothetical protein